MRAFQRLLASSKPLPSGVGSMLAAHATPLLPPIPLFRRILRANRRLPVEMRALGDSMVKAEFQAHKESENPIHIVGFLTEWQSYLQRIEGDSWRGEQFDKAKLDKMSDEQIMQMYELMQACKETGQEAGDAEIAGQSPTKGT